jgi:hypothetical protein
MELYAKPKNTHGFDIRLSCKKILHLACHKIGIYLTAVNATTYPVGVYEWLLEIRKVRKIAKVCFPKMRNQEFNPNAVNG